jgi:hypothetical protein
MKEFRWTEIFQQLKQYFFSPKRFWAGVFVSGIGIIAFLLYQPIWLYAIILLSDEFNPQIRSDVLEGISRWDNQHWALLLVGFLLCATGVYFVRRHDIISQSSQSYPDEIIIYIPDESTLEEGLYVIEKATQSTIDFSRYERATLESPIRSGEFRWATKEEAERGILSLLHRS